MPIARRGLIHGYNLVQDIRFIPLDSPPPWREGLVFYDTQERALVYYNEAADVAIQVGHEMVVTGVNKTGAQIPDGTAVYVSGAQGNRPKIAPAVASDGAQSDRTIAIATHDIENNAEGYVTTFGRVSNFDTSGFTTGDPLWLDPVTPGAITNVKPTAPDHSVFVGWALNSTVNGKIFVSVHNGTDLQSLHDVLLGTLTDGAALAYDLASGVWRNVPLSFGEIYETGAGRTLVFSANDTPVAIGGGNLSATDLAGWTFANGQAGGTITGAVGNGTTVTLTVPGTWAAGMPVSVEGNSTATPLDGLYIAQEGSGVNTLVILNAELTPIADGSAIGADYLTADAGVSGVHEMHWGIGGKSSGGAAIEVHFHIQQCDAAGTITEWPKGRGDREFAGSAQGYVATRGLIDIAEGDKIWLTAERTVGVQNLVINETSFTISRAG